MDSSSAKYVMIARFKSRFVVKGASKTKGSVGDIVGLGVSGLLPGLGAGKLGVDPPVGEEGLPPELPVGELPEGELPEGELPEGDGALSLSLPEDEASSFVPDEDD